MAPDPEEPEPADPEPAEPDPAEPEPLALEPEDPEPLAPWPLLVEPVPTPRFVAVPTTAERDDIDGLACALGKLLQPVLAISEMRPANNRNERD